MKKSIKCLAIIFLVATSLAPLTVTQAAGSEFRVVIDPGHGGGDRGVQLSRNLFEKDLTVAVAKKIVEILSHEPSVSALLTRSDDSDVSLDARRSVIRSSNADLLISIHVNAGFSMSASGYEIYFPDFPASDSKDPAAREVIDTMLERTFINNSIRYSNILDRELGRVFPREGRGVRGAPMILLRDAPMPAVLVELGFASNVRNRDALRDSNIQERLAGAIADSIKMYFAATPSRAS